VTDGGECVESRDVANTHTVLRIQKEGMFYVFTIIRLLNGGGRGREGQETLPRKDLFKDDASLWKNDSCLLRVWMMGSTE